MINKSYLMALALLISGYSVSAGASYSVDQCQATTVVGSVCARSPGFAAKMRALRKQCAQMRHHREAAEIVYTSGYYECVVGSFCGNTGE